MFKVRSHRESRADEAAIAPLSVDKGLASLASHAWGLAAVATVWVGSVVLIGWRLNLPMLTGIIPGYATMKPNAALSFVAAGVALWLLRRRNGTRGAKVAGLLCASLTVLVGTLTLVEYLFTRDLGIDELLITGGSKGAGSLHPG